MAMQPITGAILAGGTRQGRTGGERALQTIGDERLIERQLRNMRELCREIIVVTDNPRPFLGALDGSVRLITDYYAGCGPLGGIHAALQLARHAKVWIVGCDMPAISSEAAARLARRPAASGGGAVLPLIGGVPVALHGIYDKRLAVTAEILLSEGERGSGAIGAFLGRIAWDGVAADAWLAEEGIGNFAYAVRSRKARATVR